ncbi:MAG: sulfatase-like hydrolase/transferase [Coleofasciculus sp. D1-CHI-01]|uniref:sulfatase-like hydrolase/transferase n=1 Tax=Coleofasciculus sp. D1-CHI-01 TaxID=3068482 RepID=UPI0032F271DE
MTYHSLSRRSFIQYAVAGTATVSLLGSCRQKRSHSQSQDLELPPLSPQADGYNILFIFTDQERYFRQKPSGLTLPGHERLQQTGITFHNHYTSSTMCTASRSVLLTGLSTPVNGMFENTDVRYVSNLSTDIPTYGHLLRKSGYYTAYKGKWHLSRDFESEHKPLDLTQAMAEYGFSDYYDPGDIVGHTLGGYLNDHLVAGSAIRWLRNRGRMLNDPDVEGGQNCQALTSHIDLVPTFLSLAGVKVEEQADLVGSELPGKDLTTLLSQPEQASVDAARDSILFTYSGLMTNDSELVRFLSIVKDEDGGIRKAIKEGTRPNLKKRGSLRTVFDGRYKFTRYFSPTEHNQPSSLEDLYAANDVELFDLKDDPQEMNNLALDKSKNEDLLLSMNQKLQQRIQSEIGKDDGSELPNVPGINWSLAKIDL